MDKTHLCAHFFDEFRVEIDGVPAALGRSGRVRHLLAFVIDWDARAVPRDVLMEVFWPGATPDGAKNCLHVAMSRLRKALATTGPATLIECRGDTYRLADRVDVWSDVAELERRSDRAALLRAEGALEAAAREFEVALSLRRGEFLADAPYTEWVLARREALRARAIMCAEQLSELLLVLGEPMRSLTISTRILQEEPSHEPVARQLMIAYARLGQPHMALRHYERIVQSLRRDLSVAPSPETVELATRIQRRVAV